MSPSSKRLLKIARDLRAHNFGALSDRVDVLGKIFTNLKVEKALCSLHYLKLSCKAKVNIHGGVDC